MPLYPCRFRSGRREVDTAIVNTYVEGARSWDLEMVLDGLTFRGRSFTDFRIEAAACAPDALDGLVVRRVFDESEGQDVFVLQDFELEIAFPLTLLERDGSSVSTHLHVCLTADGESRFWIPLGAETFRSLVREFSFQAALSDLNFQMRGRFSLQNCFGCTYGDYSPFGAPSFGSMLCFRRCREVYRKTRTVDGFFALMAQAIGVQETHCCPEFEPRGRKNAGSRGRIA